MGNQDWIKIKSRKTTKDMPSEIRIDLNGNVYIDNKPYTSDDSAYSNLSVNIEKHNRINFGEDTQKIIESAKTAKKGETVAIKDIKTPDSSETTIVKF